MARCHECGSKVAKIDVFCPYCGISLAAAGDEAADSSADIPEDISVQGPTSIHDRNTADQYFNTKENPFDALSAGFVETESGNVEQGPGSGDLSEGLQSPHATDTFEGLPKTADNIRATTTSEFSLESETNIKTIEANHAQIAESLHETDIEPTPSSEDAFAQPSDETSEPNEESISEATTDPEFPLVQIGSENSEMSASNIQEMDEQKDLPTELNVDASSVPQSPAVIDDTEANESAAVLNPLENNVLESRNLNKDLFEERIAHTDAGIAKPAEDLDLSDQYSSNSTFDSVRIIENKPPSPQEHVATRIRPVERPTPLSPESQVPQSADSVSESPKGPASYTGHSIGSGDTDGRKGAKLKPLTEGTVLNSRYEIVRKIGGGGMGAVYLASDNNLGGVLRAVKEMVQAHMEEDQQDKAVSDFKRESMILSTLDHPAIPTIYDYFYDEPESRFYLVMKYISGGDLASRLRSAPEGKIDERSVTEWAIQIIDVLDYLHNQPSTIVYRDLKPSNIMIDGNTGRVMLIDFGIARSISKKEEKGVTAVGTMGYAPPELFSGNVEPRSDIYSLGSTMFHLLSGADPQSNPLLIFDFQKNPRPRQINPQLSDQMERVLMKSVEYNADARFSSAAEMRSILEDHLTMLKMGKLTYGVGAAPASVSLANQNVFCGFCGQRIVATDLFCAFCGAKQPIAQQGVHAEIYARGALTAKLVVEGTSGLSAPVFSLQKDENLLGRRDPMSNIFPEVDLSKYDPQTKISRRHARIWREGTSYLVEDLGSSNGTILERSKDDDPFRLIPKQPQALTSGDILKVGDATLHFLIG